MSEAVTAMQMAEFDGLCRVADAGLQGMIVLRGDLGSDALRSAVQDLTGAGVPKVRRVLSKGTFSVLWMSPDELMILCPYAQADAHVATLAKALEGQHALVANLSDARAVFALTGAGLREVVAKVAPIDMAPGAFGPGDIRRTRFAQVSAAVWMTDDTSARVVCFRSVAEYMFNLLRTAAHPGAGVGFF